MHKHQHQKRFQNHIHVKYEKQLEFDKTQKDAKEYFKELVDSIETYKMNSGGTAG